MRPGDLSQLPIRAQHVLQQRVVIEHIDRSGMIAQRLFQISQYFTHTRFRERIEEKNHKRIVGQGESGRVGADRLERETFLRVASVLAQVLLRDLCRLGRSSTPTMRRKG